jgi:hypothetical protein
VSSTDESSLQVLQRKAHCFGPPSPAAVCQAALDHVVNCMAADTWPRMT